jgi:hypothetical protein
MRGGYVGLMNCVFAAQKAVRPLSVFHRFTSIPLEGMSLSCYLRLEYDYDILTRPRLATNTCRSLATPTRDC